MAAPISQIAPVASVPRRRTFPADKRVTTPAKTPSSVLMTPPRGKSSLLPAGRSSRVSLLLAEPASAGYWARVARGAVEGHVSAFAAGRGRDRLRVRRRHCGLLGARGCAVAQARRDQHVDDLAAADGDLRPVPLRKSPAVAGVRPRPLGRWELRPGPRPVVHDRAARAARRLRSYE